jgi:hypothetical protein
MFPHSSQFLSTSRSPLIPWLVAGLLVLALAPAAANAMPGRDSAPQQVQQDKRAPDQVNPAPASIGGPQFDLRAPDQIAPAQRVDTTKSVYGSNGPLPTTGPLPMSHVTQSPAVEPPSSGDDTDVWLIVGIGAAVLAACLAGIGAARRTRVRTVRHA